MTDQPAAKCQRCRQDLSPGNGYCIACGFDNSDVEAKKYAAIEKADQRIERAGMLRKIFRIMRFGRWI